MTVTDTRIHTHAMAIISISRTDGCTDGWMDGGVPRLANKDGCAPAERFNEISFECYIFSGIPKVKERVRNCGRF